ncbi:MAG TPA: hypothetical protein VFB75_20110 [Burkholderiales bacterium]|nr:hypothetical protein [Burkholderiales bacterium]
MDYSETAEAESTQHAGRRLVSNFDDAFTETDNAFHSGAIQRLSSATLRVHLLTLANQPARELQQRDVIRSMLIAELLLQRQMERIVRRVSRDRWIAAAVALAALLTSLLAILFVATREPLIIQAPPPPLEQQQQPRQ